MAEGGGIEGLLDSEPDEREGGVAGADAVALSLAMQKAAHDPELGRAVAVDVEFDGIRRQGGLVGAPDERLHSQLVVPGVSPTQSETSSDHCLRSCDILVGESCGASRERNGIAAQHAG